jgi:large subunit ribosomal protein L3
MLNGLLGKKVGMTQFFSADGIRFPVTAIQAGPVTVIQKKTLSVDGYNSVQVGYGELSESKTKKRSKAYQKHFKEQKTTRHLREFIADDIETIQPGQKVDLGIFTVGDKVDVSGTSKGKGFTGVMKRHNFAGGPSSHGHRFNRGTGSIGQSATPARVFKGKKMAGQHGNKRVTVQGLEIVHIDPELNVVLVKGSIPGPNNGLVEIRKTIKG